MKKLVVCSIMLLTVVGSFAQRRNEDTTRKTVVITSAYKPVLKPSSKINFTASTPPPDTTKPALTAYKVPSQNLFFSYQPAALKPLALAVDSAMQWVNSNYVKAGFGNYTTPYLEAGLSYGDGKSKLINFYGRHVSQKGSLPFQQSGHTTFNFAGLYSSDNNLEWRTKIGFDNRTQYYYGYRPDTLKFAKDSLRQRYNLISGMIGLRNKEVNQYGISYDPSLAVNYFYDNRSAHELTFIADAPFSKKLTDNINVNLAINANMTSYKRTDSNRITNNLFVVAPSVSIKKTNFALTAGISPAWDNGATKILPNISGLVKIDGEKFVVMAGFVGSFVKNTYQSLSMFNPWIRQPDTLFNTRINELYGGFKGSAGSHFTYNARLSFLQYSNAVLYTNDTLDGKTFNTPLETTIKALRISGEVGYTVQEKFSLLGGVVINNFSGLEKNERPYGLLPLEVTGSLRWQVLPDLQFKSDLFMWNGAMYRTRIGFNERASGAFDLNLGAELKVAPRFNVWMQFNNIFNNKYERWNQYQVVGINILGGIVYSF